MQAKDEEDGATSRKEVGCLMTDGPSNQSLPMQTFQVKEVSLQQSYCRNNEMLHITQDKSK
jgi:hypothetical protein